MSVLRVNQIANENGDGPVEFSKGVIFPESQTFTSQELTINTTGVATVTSLTAESINVVGVMTGGTFVGNGFNITNPPGTSSGKVIGLHLIS
jgi:hypothetical protein